MMKKLAGFAIFIFMLTVFCGCISVKDRYQLLAEQGNGEAQAILGASYLTGGMTPINYEEALSWLRKSSARGSAIGMYYLGVIHETGLGSQSPSQVRALRLYENAFETIRKQASDGDINALYALAEMYYYGRGVAKSPEDAYKMFDYCASKAYYPAIVMLGVMHMTGNGTEKNLAQAREMFLKAAEDDYPVAQYYLSEIYRQTGKRETTLRWLEKAAGCGYPPAMYNLAELNKANIGQQKSKDLIMQAAQAGYAPAQLAAAGFSSDYETKLNWLKSASERNYVPAMLELAEMFKTGIDVSPTKSMILYELAGKLQKNNQDIISRTVALDNKTGLYFPIKFCWSNFSGGENLVLAESDIFRIIDGFKTGIIDGSKTVFTQRLSENPSPFYLDNDWFLIYDNRLPLLWAGKIFEAVKSTEQDTPGFWLSYGISAGLAGQGEIQAFAAFQLKSQLKKFAGKPEGKIIADLSALMKANAMILMGREEEAYASLFSNGKLNFTSSPYVINFINFWCKPLLKERNKLSVASGIEQDKLTDFSFPIKQEFYDLQLNQVIGLQPPVEEPVVDYQSNDKKQLK